MWFYFSGSGLEQQSGAQRRDSRSGSGGELHRAAGGGESSATTGGGGGAIEHRKSTAGQEKGEKGTAAAALRRESRSKDSVAGAAAAPSKELKEPKHSARRSTGAGPPPPPSAHRPSAAPQQPHRGSTISEFASSAIQSTGTILANILRALLVRALLMAHSMLCIWAAAEKHGDNSVWAFALVAFCLVGEGFYAVVVRVGEEPTWFSPAIAVYLLATTPPLWLLQSSLCEMTVAAAAAASPNGTTMGGAMAFSFGLNPNTQFANDANGLAAIALSPQALTYSLFVVLLFARWLLPRLELSREELTQILLAYMAIMTDICEFMGLLNFAPICAEHSLRNAILAVFTLSLFQFTLILTATRSRKMRIAVATKILLSTNRPDIRQAFFDLDIWALLIALALQDVPFLVVRLCILAWFWNVHFASLAFICKNALIILIQAYRVSVLLNDRYRNPEISTRSLLNEKRQSIALPSGMSLSQHQIQRLSRTTTGREKETALMGGGGGGNNVEK